MAILALLFLVLCGLKDVPAPPKGALDAELTKAANERLAVEAKTYMAELDKDPRPAAEREEIRRKLAAVKIAVYTTPASIDETAAYYAGKIKGASFLFAERSLLIDAQEIARGLGTRLDVAVEREWHGKQGRSARWRRDDGALEIDVEDHLVDPRSGQISRKTVVMITSAE